MGIEVSTPSDLAYIVSLAKKHSDALGFIPRAAMAARIDSGCVKLATENNDPCGFFLTSGMQPTVKIFQACVQTDARGLNHAKALLADLICRTAAAGGRSITLHCRDELESNGFWSACGFKLDSLILGGHTRRKIVNQWRLDIGAALASPVLDYQKHFLARLRSSTFERGAESCLPSPCTRVPSTAESGSRCFAGFGTTGDRTRGILTG
jgi:hypothetical protein